MKGEDAVVKLPHNLAPGNYMIRHEIIALHLANSKGGAEFYAGCVQLKVGGIETGFPRKDGLVKLPGAYSDNDPGIFVPNVKWLTVSSYIDPLIHSLDFRAWCCV